MARIKIAIFDADKGYRERFADYLMNYRFAEIELTVFTNITFFSEAINVDKFHLLVLGSGYEDILVKVKGKNVPIMILTETTQIYVKESVEMRNEQVVYVSKYQSMDRIIKQMQLLAEPRMGQHGRALTSRKMDVIGVFSPMKHELQMLFSMLYAKNAGIKQKVLYVNLLEFSGFTEVFGETEYDVGDAILQMRGACCRREALLECIYNGEKFSYIAPFVNPENVTEVTGEDVKGLLEWIVRETDYQMVIVDIGANVKRLAEAMTVCSKICVLGKKGFLYEIQMRQFLMYLERAMEEEFLQRVEQIELPGQVKVTCSGVNLLEQLDWSEFGDFVRSRI